MEERKTRPRPRKSRRKVCAFCVDKLTHIDYKDTARLRKFITAVSYTHLKVCTCIQYAVDRRQAASTPKYLFDAHI